MTPEALTYPNGPRLTTDPPRIPGHPYIDPFRRRDTT